MGYFIEFWYAKNQLHSTGYVMCSGVDNAKSHALSVLRDRNCSFARVLDASGKRLICIVSRDGRVIDEGRSAFGAKARKQSNAKLVAGFAASTLAWVAAFVAICLSTRPWLNAALLLFGLLAGCVSCYVCNLLHGMDRA